MNDMRSFERCLLKNCVVKEDLKLNSIIGCHVLDGKYETVLHNRQLTIISKFISNVENINETIIEAIRYNLEVHLEWLSTGIASILLFVQYNWTGPQPGEDFDFLSILREKAIEQLSLDDECNLNMMAPELLYLAKIIFSCIELQKTFVTAKWWLFRTNFIHQLILEESSSTIFNEMEKLIESICHSDLLEDDYLNTIFNLEVALFYIHYRRIQSSEKYLENAKNSANITLELGGALGIRTKYQREEKAQLFLKIRTEKESLPWRACDNVPIGLNLNDDLRLERIKFSEDTDSKDLGSVEEGIILTEYFLKRIIQPKYELSTEENNVYLTTIIEHTRNWPLKMSSLFQRCIIESSHKRTIERSIAQLTYLLEELNDMKVEVRNRMDLFFISGMEPRWSFKKLLADQKLNLGLVKGALELYLELQLWEDVILCYTILGLKQEAAEVIRREIVKKPTVKLWCLLGDATGEEEYYEIAWKLSGKKSSRAQRHWGFFHFNKKNFREAVQHLKLSVEINNIQENVWLRLGYACLEIEDWNLAARAYRRYCDLEQTNHEVWNNLSKAYIKLGEKEKAYRALLDAIRCNYDRWEIWNNLMIVSTDLGRFTEVIRCYHRILDLKSHHLDTEVLSIMSKAIINNINDAENNLSREILPKALELLGRVTSSIPNDFEAWRIYAELSAVEDGEINNRKTAHYLQRAYRAAVSDPKWFQRIESVKHVLETCIRLTEVYERCLRQGSDAQKKSMLGSLKLSLQSVIKKVKNEKLDDERDIIDLLLKVEEKLENILNEKFNNS